MSMPSDISAGLSAPALPPDAERLTVTAVVNGQRRIAETDHPVTIIGSRRDCGLSLPHPSVGKLHAAIAHLGNRLVLCDLRGREDTLVNGVAIDRITLAPGMEVQIGEVAVKVEFPPDSQLAHDPPQACDLTLYEDDTTLPIDQAVTVIGRWAASNIVLDTSDVSLSHALVFPFFGRPVVADLASRSGVLVNGELTSAAWLDNEDTIQIGEHLLHVSLEKPSEAEAAEFIARLVPTEEISEQPLHSGESIVPPPLESEDELASLSSSLAALRSQFTQAQANLSQQAAGIREHAAKLAARETELQLRLQEMTSREQELSQREQREAQAAQHLAQFRNALQEASSAFADYVPPKGDGDELPAPMVDGAMFNAAAAAMQAAKGDLPPGLLNDDERPMAIAN